MSDKSESKKCKACGAKFWGVDEEECNRIAAQHILDEHSDEAPEPVLEQAREKVASNAG